MAQNSKHFDSGRYDFLGKAKYLVPVTILLTIVGIVLMFAHGLTYGIDFAGGTEIQVKFQGAVTSDEVREFAVKEGYSDALVQSIGSDNEFLIRMESPHGKTDEETQININAMVKKVSDGLITQFADKKPEIRRVDSVGPAVGEELKRNGVLAAFYCLIVILIYVGLRFDYKYAPGAVFCLFHDTIVVMSVFAIMKREVNVQTLAAVLTLIGYSMNDTIINFDRIRENEKLFPNVPFYDLVNRSINDMLSRTILTSGATFLSVITLYFFADGVIQDIAFTMAIGIIIGTYSSIYIASPLVIAYHEWEHRKNTAAMKRATTA